MAWHWLSVVCEKVQIIKTLAHLIIIRLRERLQIANVNQQHFSSNEHIKKPYPIPDNFEKQLPKKI